ncbi:methylamine dehydrogenase light chain precursor [Acetobacter estunensis NRIC 0472]|uniref:Methylamine dehydrogenase (amicyanin) n=1 Tax=Acetobacter estunensis TaxID=104097 RepID=A0A967BCZ5_9PROT|nr:methylamine dehydrogenase (amicyanin) small subunit [Acetobacter estunensis]NHO54107.1 methylamine dehydrogenase (amicyanin) small subunit [Acetobacter estunensis]GBQ20840.1 methylamine dehydrogenase light chain precursor [Acetobacter estunensis NRIC 0472]
MLPSETATKQGSLLDRLTETVLRRIAGHSSRRDVITRIGGAVAAAPAFMLLPVSRADAASAKPKAMTPFGSKAQAKDENACDYWRYCAIDGNLCTSCGGGVHSCPPGTAPSPTSWIGSCYNPQDGNSYMIAYRDCCGQDSCNEVTCLNTDGDQPSYRPMANNDIIWCFGTGTSEMYNCSTAAVIGKAS